MFVSGKSFQPSLMFVGKARGLPYSGAPERCFTRLGNKLERLALASISSLVFVCKARGLP